MANPTDRRRWHTDPKLWKKHKPLARGMRHEPTPEEDIIWGCLRSRKLDGYKFRRQYPIGVYIVDFCCPESKLVVEIEGSVHDTLDQQAYDNTRFNALVILGSRILRIRNEMVHSSLAEVLNQILTALNAKNT